MPSPRCPPVLPPWVAPLPPPPYWSHPSGRPLQVARNQRGRHSGSPTRRAARPPDGGRHSRPPSPFPVALPTPCAGPPPPKDRTHADRTHADRTHTDRTHADSTHADRTHADRTHADRTHADRTHADRTHAHSHPPQHAPARQTCPGLVPGAPFSFASRAASLLYETRTINGC